MQIYKTTEIVTQIQRTKFPCNMEGGAICNERLFVHVPFEIYVREPLSPPESCPILGKLRLNDVTGSGRSDGVYSVEIGCEEAQVVGIKHAQLVRHSIKLQLTPGAKNEVFCHHGVRRVSVP